MSYLVDADWLIDAFLSIPTALDLTPQSDPLALRASLNCPEFPGCGVSDGG